MDVSERLKRNWDRLHVEEGNRSPSADDNSVSARLDRNRERYQRRKTEEEFQTRMNRYANRYASDLNASASSLSNPEYQSRDDMDQNVVDALIRRQEQKTASSELYRLAHEVAQDDSAQAVSGLKNYLDDTDAVYKVALDTAKYQRKNWANVYGDFSGKEEYDAVREASAYQQKYGKMTDDELASVVSGMEKNKALSAGERAWLNSYIGGGDRQDAAYRVYEINQGKIADLDKQISPLRERLKTIDEGLQKPSSVITHEREQLRSERQQVTSALQQLTGLKSALEAQNNIYERNGLKQYQYGQLRKNEDYEANRDNRTVNPTVEDFDPYYAAKRADYEWIENPGITPDPSARQQLPAKPEIQDRLGFWETYKDDPSLLGTDQTSGKIESNNEAREDYNLIRDGWDRHWDLLTEDEIGTYYYLYNTRGREEAEKYLDDFQSVLNRRNIENADQYMEEHFEDMSTLEQIVGTAAGVMVNAALSPLAFTDSVARTVKGEDVDPYSNAYSFQRAVAKMRELQSASIEEWTGGKSFLGLKLSDVYGSLLSFADSRAMQAIYGKAATVFMGMSAASSRAAELYDQGASNDDLVMGSLLAGVAEAAFEYISLEKFVSLWEDRTSLTGWRKKLGKWLGATLAEGSEEVATDLANLLTDSVIRADQSDFMRKVNNYLDEGKSESEAYGLTWGDQLLDLYKSFAGGVISGGIGAGLEIAAINAQESFNNQLVGERIQNLGNTQDMLNEAMNSDDARIRKLAQDVVDAQNKGKDSRTNRKLGKLYQANEQKAIDALNEASDKGKQKKATRAAFEKAARDYFTEKGTQNIDNAVKLFTAAAFDGLSTKQRGEFNNLGGEEVLSSLVNQANQEVGQQTREQKGKALASRAKNMLNLTVDRAGALEQTAKKAANFSRESVRMLETIIDGDNMVSSNGKTTLASTGERVEISRIASLDKAGKMTFSLSDGRTVDSSDIRYANRAQALIYESMRAVGYAPQTASNLAGIAQSTVRPDLPASRVVLGLQKAYEYGWGHVAEGSRQSEYFAALPQEARELAMEFGREAREAYDAELREKQQKKAAAKAQEEQKKASVRFEGGVTEENAGERVKAARDALALVAEKSGVSFVITDEISNRENGHYDPKTNTIYLSPDAGKSGQRTILWTASHELVHAVKEAGVDDFNLLADTLMETYGKKGVNIDALVAIEQEKAARAGAELSFRDAYEEVVAQAMQDFLTDSEQGFFRTMQNLEAKKPGIGEILLEAIQRILQRIAGIYNGMKPTDAAYAYVGRMNEELGRMYEIMTRALTGEAAASQQSTKADTKKAASKEGGVKAQIRWDAETDLAKDYAAPITAKDVEELRSIGRKSVSQFTSEDLQKAGKWARKFYRELGTKSPFFRAWFGDWRAHDLTKATVVKGTESEYAGAGKITNKDMNRSVSWGDVLKKETQVHSRKNDTIKFLGDIGNIVENAVLFDTVVSEASSKTKMPNTAFMHSLYSVYKTNGETYLLKLYVEEALPNRGGDPFSRAYELKTIEKIANLPNGVLSVSEGLTDGKSAISNLTVADLFSLVKTYDKDFSAGAAANPMFLNDNGTPKMFYHGSRTGGFTEFRSWQYFSEKKNYAQGYADRNNENSLYAVYLHADKIFDTRDAEARRIFYDIRQEYGLGEVQEDTGLPDWTDGYDLSDYLEEHPELGYDAILLDEGGDMIDGKPVSRGESIVIKNSSQIKSATDNLGTFDRNNPDIRYQYKQNLLALHNLSEEKLLKALDLGGFPMPSIAVTKNNIPHTNFGDITLVMDPSTVDPKADSRNTVYSADAWTPTFPGIDYEASPETVKRVKDKYYELARKLGYDRARPLYSYAQDLSEQLTKAGGEQSLMDTLAQDTDLMNLFLADSGQEPVTLQQKELRTRLKDSEIELYDSLIQSLGEKALQEMKGSGKESPFTARRRWLEQHRDELRQAYADYYRGNGISESEIESLLNAQTDQERLREAVRARNYLENGPETVKTEPDSQATERLIREKTDGKAYQKWLSALFAGAEKSKGVYNNKDPFKQNGDRRSFSETHWPVTLDNIAKAMAGQNGGSTKNVAGFYGVKTLRAGMAERFSSIEDMHRLESRLQNLTQEESEAIQNALSDRLEEVIDEIVREAPDWIQKEFFPGNSIGLVLEELAEEGNYTVEAIKRKFNGEYQYRIGEDTAESIRELLFDIREMPVNLFEAKPERSVRFDEVRAAVLPSDSSQQLKERLQKAGVELLEYERGNTEQRMEQINSIENVKFQYMNADPLEQNVKKILEMSDQEARKRKADDEYILVSETTPQIILDKVEGAPNHKIIIRFDAAYLSMRSSGALPGNYHGYGKNFANTLMEILSDPDAIIQQRNGRINLFGRIQSGNGAQNLVSVELNVIKNIDKEFRPYNLVVTVFPAKENYIRNLLQREGVTVKYEKETLPQVNHQLHEWLAIVNGKISSGAIIAQKNEARQEEKSQYRDYTSINERRALVAALEASAQTDSEKMALTEYRRNLGYLEQQEQKLVQLRREIRELSFAKGKRDMAQIQSLREEAMLTSNRIDTADKALLRGEKMAPIKRLLQSETEKAALAEKQRAAAALREEKQAASKEQRELADRYRERMRKNVEGRKMTETKNKIKRAVSDLRSLMNAGKDRANVKIELRPAVQQALDTADVLFSNMSDAEVFRAGIHPVGEIEINAAKRYEEFLDRVERMQAELKELPKGSDAYREKAKNLETNRQSLQRNGKILQQAFIRERAALNALPVSSAIQALADAYKDLGESKSPHVAAAYDSTVYGKLLSIKTDLGGTTVQNMSLAQLESVYDAYKLIRKTVRDANRVWREGKWEDVQTNGDAVVREVQEVRPQRDSRAAAVGRMNTIVLNELKPYYFFEAVGSPTLSRFYDSLRAGEDIFARDVYETQSFLDDVFEQTEGKKWDMDKTFSITLEEGRTVQLSLGEMLSIYAYSKREQALKHMSEGGFMRPGTQVKTGDDVKGKIRDALLPSEDTGRKAFRVKEADVGKIVEALNKADENYIVYADRMQKFLSEVMGAKGNEASRALYAIDLFKEQYYFPLQSSKDFMASAATPPGESSLRNSGMTKETTPGAKNPIILQSFNDVWASHVNKMSLYHAFVLPIDAMNKLLNYTDFYQSGEPVSVKTALNASWGRGAYEYIHQLLVDLNGGVTVPGAKSPIGALIGRFKKTAVAANLSVMVQQPTAILRAMTVIDPSSFIPLTGLSHKAKWEQLKKYAPVAVLKEMGGFDVGSGRQLQQYLFGDSSLMAKIDDLTMKGAAFGDEIGWNMIWDAAKRQVHRETGLSYDSEDLLQQAGKLFTKAVHQTQVYDSVLSRSGYMRSQSDLVKMSTSFMAEPTTTVNMLYNAVLQLKRGKMSFQQASRTVAFTFLASIAAAVAQSFVTAARDKDEDKTYYEKLLGDLVGNTLSNTFIPGMLPVLRDVVSLLEGWDVERTDMALVNDLIAAVKTATSDKKSTYDKVEAISGAFANFFGIPLRNILRDGRAFYNVVRAFFSDTPTTGQGIKEAIQAEIPFFGHDASNAESLYNAYVSGDRVMRDRVIGRYKDEEAAQTALKSEIRRRYLKGQLDRETALRNLQEFVGENVDEAYWSLDRWDYAKAEGTAEGYDRYEDLYNVIPQGTGTKAVLQTYLDNGVSRQALAAEITRHFKPLYRDMSPTERSNIRGKLLNAYEALGYSRTKKLAEIISWGSEESDYADLFKTIQRGTGTKQALQDYLDKGTPKSTLADKITDYFKPKYQAMGETERSNIRGKLLNAYEALGYNRQKKLEEIVAWGKEKKE